MAGVGRVHRYGPGVHISLSSGTKQVADRRHEARPTKRNSSASKASPVSRSVAVARKRSSCLSPRNVSLGKKRTAKTQLSPGPSGAGSKVGQPGKKPHEKSSQSFVAVIVRLIVVEPVFVRVTLPPVTVPTGVGPRLSVLGFTLSTFDAIAAVDDAAISAAASMRPAPSFFMTHLTSSMARSALAET